MAEKRVLKREVNQNVFTEFMVRYFNGIFGLTDKEISVLVYIIDNGFDKDKIVSVCNIGKNNLPKYINALISKKVLLENSTGEYFPIALLRFNKHDTEKIITLNITVRK